MLKVGDRVRCVKSFAGFSYLIGKTGKVVSYSGSTSVGVEFDEPFKEGHDCNGISKRDNGRFGYEDCLELISNSKKNMNLKEKFAMMLKGEPEKSFFKAGITKSDYSFTEEGKEIFLQWLLKKNGEAFKAEVVDGLLASEEDK